MTVAIFECESIDLVPKEVDPEVERHEAQVAAALRALRAAEKAVDRRRDELAEKIVEAFRTNKFKAARLAKIAEYTPEHVRRILRAHGIEGDPTRLSPTQRARHVIRYSTDLDLPAPPTRPRPGARQDKPGPVDSDL